MNRPEMSGVEERGMARGEHHYVPQFYLRLFGSSPRRTNLFNLSQGRAIQGVSIRDQCRRRRFYGKTDTLERHIMQIESVTAPVLRRINESRKVPLKGTPARELLIGFVTLQLLRTAAAANRANESADKMFKQAFRMDPRVKEAADGLEIYSRDAVRIPLASLEVMIYALQDLKPHLLSCTGDQFFITSDSPVFRYNQYWDGLEIQGLGANARGLQIFFPLSPSLLLMLYDGWVYKVGRNNLVSSDLPDDDIDALNGMHVAGAEENLYFSDWDKADQVADLFQRFKGRRRKERVEVVEYVDEEDENRSLLRLTELAPRLGLRLSFVGLRREARRVPHLNRLGIQRREIPASLMQGWAPRTPPVVEELKGKRTFRRLSNDS